MDSSDEELQIHMDRFNAHQEMCVQRLQEMDDESDEDRQLQSTMVHLYSGQIPRAPKPKEGRFRMPRHLVLKIIGDLCQVEPQFNYQYDAINIRGHSHEQKITASLRILGYGMPVDATDEYIRMGKTTAYKYLSLFCEVIMNHFGQRFTNTNAEDVEEILAENGDRGFPGMLGSLHCMHWAWLGLGRPERGLAPRVNFIVNDNRYTHRYYLADGIYPRWSTLVQAYEQPLQGNEGRTMRHINKLQTVFMKDVEQAFGILKKKFAISYGPFRGLDAREIHKIMLLCIILHNMVIDETQRDKSWTSYPNVELRPEIRPQYGLPARNYEHMTERIQNLRLYQSLRAYLTAHAWEQHGA